jgi:hypothetical protein
MQLQSEPKYRSPVMADELESIMHFKENIPTSDATWKHKFVCYIRLKRLANLCGGIKQTV